MRAATFDIESTSLAAVGGGMVVCVCIRPLGGKTVTFRYDELGDLPGRETETIKQSLAELAKYHLLIGHNIINFDWGFLKSRATILGVPLIRAPMAYDTCHAFRRSGLRTVLNGIGKPTSSLDHIADFFGIVQRKTKIYPREHWKTVWETGLQQKEAMDFLVKHCVDDVKMTEEIYWKLIDIDTVDRIKRLR